LTFSNVPRFKIRTLQLTNFILDIVGRQTWVPGGKHAMGWQI
jgi:hypothetical protein